MSDVLLLIVVMVIILAGTVMTTGSVLYFVVALYRLLRGRPGLTERPRETGPSQADT